MARLKLTAGSNVVAENANDNNKEFVSDRLTMFHGNVKTTFLRKEKNVSGYILPAFHPALDPEDEAFKTSFGPYRDKNDIDPATLNAKFSRWVFSAGAYRFFGNSGSDFFAPDTVPSPTGDRLPNPIVDLRKYIYGRRKSGDVTYMSLVTKVEDGPKPLLPQPQDICFMNAWCNGLGKNDDPDVKENRVLLLSKTAMGKVYDELNTMVRRGVVTPVDPDWDDYTLGDVTNPKHAVKFKAVMHPGSVKKYDYPGITFGNAMTGQGVETAQLTAEMLAGRYDLEDDTVFRICTYDEIVMLLLREGAPYELVRDVCADHCREPFPAEGSYSLYEARRNDDRPAQVQEKKPEPQPAKPEQPSALAQKAQTRTFNDYDPDKDDIPMNPSAPVHSPAAKAPEAPKPAPAGDGALSADEAEEYAMLHTMLMTDSGSMTADDIQRYRTLKARRQAHGVA